MSATTVINSAIPAGQSVSVVFPTPGTWRGVQIIIQQTMAKVCPVGCKVERQVELALRSPKMAKWLFGERALPLLDYFARQQNVEEDDDEVLDDPELRGDFRD